MNYLEQLGLQSIGDSKYKVIATGEIKTIPDYGSNPLGDGKVEMFPSGDVVDIAEAGKRLGRPELAEREPSLIGAYSKRQVEMMQGSIIK